MRAPSLFSTFLIEVNSIQDDEALAKRFKFCIFNKIAMN